MDVKYAVEVYNPLLVAVKSMQVLELMEGRVYASARGLQWLAVESWGLKQSVDLLLALLIVFCYEDSLPRPKDLLL